MTASAVNDFVTDPMRNGVCAVTGRPVSSATPKSRKCTIRSPRTMPSATPGDAQVTHLFRYVGVDGGEIGACSFSAGLRRACPAGVDGQAERHDHAGQKQ